MTRSERYRGCLLGLAVGDAVGTTLEFRHRGTFEPLTDMVGSGPFGLLPGQWTDDTSMALCLAVSLVERRSFDADDQMCRYCRWAEHGYLSSTGTCGERISAIARGTYRSKAESEIRGSGYVVHSLEAALWAFSRTESFADAILLAANLGEDADTTAAVCGQVAGAYYGEQDIPSRRLTGDAHGSLQ